MLHSHVCVIATILWAVYRYDYCLISWMRKLEKLDSFKATEVAFRRRKIELLFLFLVFPLCGTVASVNTGVIKAWLLVRVSDIHLDTDPQPLYHSKLPQSRTFCVRSVSPWYVGPGAITVGSFPRTGYIICSTQSKVKMQAPCSKIKNFKKDSAKN